MRKQIDIGGRHQAALDDGVIDIVYDGDVDEYGMKQILELTSSYSLGGVHTVWVSDVTRLGSFTPGARKAMSGTSPNSAQEIHTALFISGATIKTKAVLALVITASKLMGPIRYTTVYCDSHEKALALGKAKVQELVRQGLAKLPEGL